MSSQKVTMTDHLVWQKWALAGMLALFTAIALDHIPGMVACGPMGMASPIVAFEIVTSPSDVSALFGVDPCRTIFANAQKLGLLLDSFWFIPLYVIFLGLGVRLSCNRWRAWIIAALLLGAVCDLIENALLFRIASKLPGSQDTIDILIVAVRLKFALLGLVIVAIGTGLTQSQGRLATICGSLIALSGLVSLSGLIGLPNPRLIGGSAVGWLLLLGFVIAVVRGRRIKLS